MREKCVIDRPVEAIVGQDSPESQVQDRELLGRRLSCSMVQRRIFERMVAGTMEHAGAFGRNA